jgi:hypothetical protein
MNLSISGRTNQGNPKHASWNELLVPGLVAAKFGRGSAMTQRFHPRRPEDGEKVWLSALVEAMEDVSRPRSRAKCQDRVVLDAVTAQLARPAPTYLHSASNLSLRK